MTLDEEYDLYADPTNQEPVGEPRRRTNWYDLDEEQYPHQFDTFEEDRGER